MKFVDPTKPYRKSGGMGHPGICSTSAEDRKCPVPFIDSVFPQPVKPVPLRKPEFFRGLLRP
jgi:hypothetical protein